jgi:hypothetical protein
LLFLIPVPCFLFPAVSAPAKIPTPEGTVIHIDHKESKDLLLFFYMDSKHEFDVPRGARLIPKLIPL